MAQAILDLICEEIITGQILPIFEGSHSFDVGYHQDKLLELDYTQIDAQLNKFIQLRECDIIKCNNFNLHSFNGFDVLMMVLSLSNDHYNFEPIIQATLHVLFESKSLSNWAVCHILRHFDETHLFFAVFFHVCYNYQASEIVSSLSTFMVAKGIKINHQRLK